MLQISRCPLCNESYFNQKVECTDYLVSKEKFSVLECINCGMLFTNPVPELKELFKYYQSENYTSHHLRKYTPAGFVYDTIRRINIRNKYKLVKSHSQHNRIIDYGCGTGEFLQYLQNNGFVAKGIEPNEKARRYAFQQNQVPVGDLEDFKILETKSFGIVTLWHVLEHVYNLSETIMKIRDVLTDDGTLIIAVPNPSSFDAAHYGHFWAAWDTPRHLYHFTPPVLKKLITRAGFEPVNFYPMKFDSYYVSLLSEKNMFGKSRIFQAIRTGYRSNKIAGDQPEKYSSYIAVFRKRRN